MTDSFARAFFRIYDRKTAAGALTFRETGLQKETFTRLCTDKTYVLPEEEIKRLCKAMKLTPEESETLLIWVKDSNK